MKKAIESMKKGKAAGCSGLPTDRIKHLGESGEDMMHEILKRVWEQAAQGFGVLVSAKERGPREASEASRSNIPWIINSIENHAWQN